MARQVKRYTKEFKQEAVNLALKSPSIVHTARELGIPAATLHTWISKFKGSQPVNDTSASGAPDIAALIAENRRLHKELVIAREEKEILKKAATYFAQHQK